MTQINNSAGEPIHHPQKKPTVAIVWGTILCIMATLAACAPTPTAAPTLTPTVDRPLIANDQNVKILNAIQAAFSQIEYGFAPLLLADRTRLRIETGPEGDELVKLAYPRQPANPADWPSMDSFVFAYAVRRALLDSAGVRRVALGRFEVVAPLDTLQDRVSHVAVWGRFADGSEAIIDLTPLATNFAARHTASEFITKADKIDNQFAAWREGVFLNVLQPLKVVTQDNNVYYLLAKVLVFPDRYEFVMCAHLVQTATPIRPLQLTRGTVAKVEVKRADFEAVHELMVATGPTVFNQKPGLLSRTGNTDPALVAVLNDHLHLLWHMVTKLEHKRPKPDVPTLTPTSTATPTATPTPTPTPTPAALPLLTS